MVVYQIDVEHFSILKPKGNAPVRTDCNSPLPFERALQRMQPKARSTQLLNGARAIQCGKQVAYSFQRVIRNFASIIRLEESSKALVPKAHDHGRL